MLGIGVMINYLYGSGAEQNHAAWEFAKGRKVESVELVEDGDAFGWKHDMSDGALVFVLEGGHKFALYDSGRSCCESRYLTTDDDLASFAGEVLHSIEVRDGPDTQGDYGNEHEQQFVDIRFGSGASLTVVTHNEHNGYYRGFSLQLAHKDANVLAIPDGN